MHSAHEQVLGEYRHAVDLIEGAGAIQARDENGPVQAVDGLNTELIQVAGLGSAAAEKCWWAKHLKNGYHSAPKCVANLLVHGSWGDATVTPFSDVELTVVLNGSPFSHVPELQHWARSWLRPFLLRIDPIQHHGAFWLWPEIMARYSPTLLPLSAYEYTWGIHPGAISFSVLDTDGAALLSEGALRSTLRSFDNGCRAYFPIGVTAYAAKRLVSNVLLVPALAEQTAGRWVSKRDAIAAVNESGGVISDVLATATRIRNEWPIRCSSRLTEQLRRLKVHGAAIPAGRFDLLLAHEFGSKSVLHAQVGMLRNSLPAFGAAIKDRYVVA